MFLEEQEEKYEEALKKFQSAVQMSTFEPQLLYNVAVCHYKLKEFAPAIKFIGEHKQCQEIFWFHFHISFSWHHWKRYSRSSELSVGMATEGLEVRSVGNTMSLHNSALVEAFNLKAAIEYQLKNCKHAIVLPSIAKYNQQSMVKHLRICLNTIGTTTNYHYQIPLATLTSSRPDFYTVLSVQQLPLCTTTVNSPSDFRCWMNIVLTPRVFQSKLSKTLNKFQGIP